MSVLFKEISTVMTFLMFRFEASPVALEEKALASEDLFTTAVPAADLTHRWISTKELKSRQKR